jgi:hypothetical protein
MTEIESPLFARKITAVVPMTPEMATEIAENNNLLTAAWEAAKAWDRLSPEEKARIQAERDAEAAAKYAEAEADWQATCLRLADNPQAAAALVIHQPERHVNEVHCAHPVDGAEAECEDWPCGTYTAIKEA